jgi:alpha-ketoglutarate-dependent taurine dioxygenase
LLCAPHNLYSIPVRDRYHDQAKNAFGDDPAVALVDDPRSWTAETVGAAAGWTHPLPGALIAPLRSIAGAPGRGDGPIADLRLTADERAALGGYLAAAKHDLERGRGFVVLDRLPVGRILDREAIALYWMIGQLLGEPITQNVQGTLLYDVRDSGQDVARGARFSVTNSESSFHTDNSFGEAIVDYVGLLCLKTARSGGVSQMVSGLAVVEMLRSEQPGTLQALCRPFHVDRRGGVREGEAPTVLRPVIELGGSEPLFRYLRYWIEAGHAKAGEPLTLERRAALDRLDALLNRPALRAEFSLEPGQVYFINNRWILHNRTAFEDHPEPERRRHLVRLWLEAGHSPSPAR